MTTTTTDGGQGNQPIPEGLSWVFLIHAIVGAIFGLALFLIPELWGEWVNWGTIDPTMTRLYGGGLLGVAVASWLGYQAQNWPAVRILVIFEVAFPALTAIAGLYEVIAANAPVFTWVVVVITAIFAIAFYYFYAQLS